MMAPNLENIAPLNTNFPLSTGCVVLHFWDIYKFNLTRRKGCPHMVCGKVVGEGQGAGTTAFGLTIPFQYLTQAGNG